jgi:DNA segregation ATPase FtsK/SpoIIIE, S-DNA-T family
MRMKKLNYNVHLMQHLALMSILCLLTFFLFASLVTFNVDDPSPFMIVDDNPYITNMFGSIGATCAATLFFLFGTAAFLLIPCLLFLVYLISFGDMKNDLDRLVALIALIPVTGGLGALYHSTLFPHHFLPGGLLGNALIHPIGLFFDQPLSFLFLNTSLIICLILIFRLSFVRIAHHANSVFQFLIMRRHWVQYAVRLIYDAVIHLSEKIAALFFEIKKLFDGTEAKKNQSYEFEILVQEEFNQMLNDPVWSVFADSAQQEEENKMIESSISKERKPVKNEQLSLDIMPIQNKITNYQLPPLNFFKKQNEQELEAASKREQEQLAIVLEEKLARFGIAGRVVSIKTGPVVTLFEYHPHIDSKISRIIALEDDLALALQATSIRIIAPIPGTSVVGFEVANKLRTTVILSTILHSKEFQQFSGKLPLVLGVDTVGNSIIADLAAMPHALVAGATGSGKSVALNVILISLLYRFKPDELKLILIDPKRLEFAPYADIPHLLFPIITHPKEAAPILQWVVKTMEERYELMATVGVRNVFDYNKQAQATLNPELKAMPYIVVMIDELSDLMMVAGKEIEEKIARVAQMARAAGIHLVVATQRPSVDVITGIIKANFPTRISFKVATKIDSRTILDNVGADKLLGRGDMLYLDTGSLLRRIHGPFVSDYEIEQVTSHVRAMQQVEYLDIAQELPQESNDLLDTDQELYQDVISYIQSVDEVSISLLQRRFRIGYNRSARIIDMLEAQGLIMPSHGGKTRKVVR